jgi:uncharacterized protein YdbL (DUF1318 family)
MKTMKMSGLLMAMLLLAGCVTINIYFPAAEAEQAADRIVDDILGKTPPPAEPKGSFLPSRLGVRLGQQLLDFLIPAAQAGTPDFTVNTPRIRQLQASMKKRFKSLKPFYEGGAIGFTKDALVSVHDAAAIGLKNKNRVKQLVAAENSDRNALYQAIAEANGHPDWEPEIRATFARTWIQKAARGWWFQASNGGWKQK